MKFLNLNSAGKMIRNSKLVSFAVVLLAIVVASCTEHSEPLSVMGRELDVDVHPWESMMAPGHTDTTYSKVIDHKGGYLVVPAANGNPFGYVLIVEANTVRKPTRFTMHVVGGTQYLVDLSAIQSGANGTTTDMGKKLLKPVLLAMSYSDSPTDLVDASRLVILYVPDDGSTPQPVPTFADGKSKYVVGSLAHFSKYTMALN